MSFVNLHVHSAQGSLLDSILRVKDIAQYAKDNGQPAIALSDHGFMHGSLNHVLECKKLGVKPITACEIYECDNHYLKNDTKENTQPRYHLLLIVKNQIGKSNLFKIVSEACTNGMYKKPRVSVDWIKENNLGEGLICLTACQAGRVSKYLEEGKYDEAEAFVRLLQKTFDYVALEIQSHPTEQQLRCNTLIYKLAMYMNVPFVITSDAHMLKADQVDTHSIFVEIGEGRETGETYVGCHLQNKQDVFKYLGNWHIDRVIQQGIDETIKIANMVDDNIDYELNKGSIMPEINVPKEFKSNLDYLRHLIYSNFDNKFGHMNEEDKQIRRDRIEHELEVLNELEFIDYFIIQYKFTKACDERGIPRGYSRGSAAASLCLFLLGVTQIDSVRWDLDFSRFANMGRKGSVPDVDLDISKARRKESIEVLEEVFGKENVSPMATFNTLSTKVAVRDIGKVLHEKENSPYFGKIPYSLRDEVAKAIPTVKTLSDLGEEVEKDVLLKELLGKNEKLDEIYKQFPLWFKYIMELEGLPKSRGRHASGTLITPKPITHYGPLCLDNEKNVMIQFEMHICQDTKGGLGLVKEDLLGLETLDLIDDTLKKAGLTWQDVDINHLNLEEQRVYDEVYKQGNTVGIFQMESFEARKMLIDAKADNIEDIVVVNAANRPGTKDNFPIYCSNKLHPEKIQVVHDDLKKIFNKTHSVLLYQEDSLHLLAYAGFNEVDQDTGRRSIGKKDLVAMKTLEIGFRDGLSKKGWTKKQQDDMWDLLLKQANYSFNRGHAVAYGLLSYLCAYLKTFYPVEFMSSLLSIKSDNTAKLSVVINDCNRMGIKVLPPHINKSGPSFTAIPKNKEILFGFMAVKGIGESVVNQIIENQPYKDFQDYLTKVQDKSATIALIKAGAFPTNNKMKMMQKYAKSLYDMREYKPVSTLPTKSKLLLDWGIDTDDYKVGKKVDKEAVLDIYNQKKKLEFDNEQQAKYKIHMTSFRNQYAQDEFLWEFQSLSMFVTNNPLQEAYSLIGTDWDDVPNGDKAVVPCVVVDVKRKRDKNNNQFAYLDLCINNQIVEATIWSKQLKEYFDLISKGSCICILGRKEDNHLFVEKIKPYYEWLSRIKLLRTKANIYNY